MATELEEVKLQVAQANRVLADVGLASGVTAALGHASMRAALIYQHATAERDRTIADAMDQLMEGASETLGTGELGS